MAANKEDASSELIKHDVSTRSHLAEGRSDAVSEIIREMLVNNFEDPSAEMDENLISLIYIIFNKCEVCSIYLLEMTKVFNSEYRLLSYEFRLAQNRLADLFDNGSWKDHSARTNVISLLKKGADLMDTAELPFLKHEIEELIWLIEEHTSSELASVS